MSRYCCCCFPVRFCVLILSTLWLLSSGATAAYSWFVLSQATSKIGSIDINSIHVKDLNVVLTSKQRDALYVVAGVSTAAFIISIFGLIGAIARKRRLVQAFFVLVLLQTLVSLAAGGYYLFEIWGHDSTQAFDACETFSNSIEVSACRDGYKVARVIVTAILGISWLIQIWILHGIHNYSAQLKDEQTYEAVSTTAYVPAYTTPAAPYASSQYDDPYYKPDGYAFSTPHTAFKSA